jgi:hypothetical protein
MVSLLLWSGVVALAIVACLPEGRRTNPIHPITCAESTRVAVHAVAADLRQTTDDIRAGAFRAQEVSGKRVTAHAT